MTSGKIIVMTTTFALLLSFCTCNTIDNIIQGFFGKDTGQRSLSDAITEYLDHLFPKDDRETRILKSLFGFFADDELPGLEGGLEALDFLSE